VSFMQKIIFLSLILSSFFSQFGYANQGSILLKPLNYSTPEKEGYQNFEIQKITEIRADFKIYVQHKNTNLTDAEVQSCYHLVPDWRGLQHHTYEIESGLEVRILPDEQTIELPSFFEKTNKYNELILQTLEKVNPLARKSCHAFSSSNLTFSGILKNGKTFHSSASITFYQDKLNYGGLTFEYKQQQDFELSPAKLNVIQFTYPYMESTNARDLPIDPWEAFLLREKVASEEEWARYWKLVDNRSLLKPQCTYFPTTLNFCPL
jgi:hypothetical protein